MVYIKTVKFEAPEISRVQIGNGESFIQNLTTNTN